MELRAARDIAGVPMHGFQACCCGCYGVQRMQPVSSACQRRRCRAVTDVSW